MTDQHEDTEREGIEREVMKACQVFRATLLRIAERGTPEAVQSTLQRAQIILSFPPQTRDARPDEERSPPPRSPPRMTRHEARTRILQRVRDAPGSTTKELAQSLGLTRGRLRYHLKMLTENGTLEFRDICPKRNFVQQRQYFCQAERHPTEPDSPRAMAAEGSGKRVAAMSLHSEPPLELEPALDAGARQ